MQKQKKTEKKPWFRTGILLSVIGFLLMGLANDSNLAVSPLFWCIPGNGKSQWKQKPSTVNVGGFFVERKIPAEAFDGCTKSETITYIMCKRG